MSDNNINPKKVEGIDDEFQDLALKLKEYDFSQNSNENRVYSRSINNLRKSGSMKRTKIIRRCSAAAIILAMSGVFVSQNTSAQAAVASFLNKVSLGHIAVFQENNEGKNPDDYKTLYDESGNEVSKETIEKGGTFYAKNGEEIKVKAKDDGKKADKLVVNDAEKINDYTCFNVKLPSNLPKGYKFKQAEFYKDKDGQVKDSKYAWLVFADSESGKEFYIQERLDCEETKYEMSTAGKVEKIEINGVDAALSDGRNIDWINDGNIYALMGEDLSRTEVIKVAESIE